MSTNTLVDIIHWRYKYIYYCFVYCLCYNNINMINRTETKQTANAVHLIQHISFFSQFLLVKVKAIYCECKYKITDRLINNISKNIWIIFLQLFKFLTTYTLPQKLSFGKTNLLSQLDFREYVSGINKQFRNFAFVETPNHQHLSCKIS